MLPEGVRVLEAAASRYVFDLEIGWFDFASCDYYLAHGRMMPGATSPLAGRTHGDIGSAVVRENTGGEYCSNGGRMFAGNEREFAVQETIMTRIGVDRILRYVFEMASSRERKHLTSATKSNGISITMPYWDEPVAEMAGPGDQARQLPHRYPDRISSRIRIASTS